MHIGKGAEEMKFETAVFTDIGPSRAVNEDSMLLMRAETGAGTVLLACVCDGMGGLDLGETASASMIDALHTWFILRLPGLLAEGLREETLADQWKGLAEDADRRIGDYGRQRGKELGTTCAVLLLAGERWFLMNIGDSRIYQIDNDVRQLTTDQTWVQKEFEMGRLTAQQMRTHPRRNLLLECIGTGPLVQPQFRSGRIEGNEAFLVCSDGFCHTLQPDDLAANLHPDHLSDPNMMERQLSGLAKLCLQRRETDNLSAVLIRTCIQPQRKGEH